MSEHARARAYGATPALRTRTPGATSAFASLHGRAGNAAVSSLLAANPGEPRAVQREDEEHESPLEPANTVLDWKDRLEVPHALKEAEEAEEAARAGTAAKAGAGEIGALGAANSTIFGPAEMGLGIFDMVSGAKRGGVGGTEQALGGAVGFTGGAATTLAPVLGAAAAPVALGATAFNTGMALGNAGIKESPYDLPGTAADWGVSAKEYVEDSWAGDIPGASSVAGAAATLGGSIAMVPGAAYYGAKSAAKSVGRFGERVGEGIGDAASSAWDWAVGNVEAEAPVIDLPATEDLEHGY
jgi:hypothetical protein